MTIVHSSGKTNKKNPQQKRSVHRNFSSTSEEVQLSQPCAVCGSAVINLGWGGVVPPSTTDIIKRGRGGHTAPRGRAGTQTAPRQAAPAEARPRPRATRPPSSAAPRASSGPAGRRVGLGAAPRRRLPPRGAGAGAHDPQGPILPPPPAFVESFRPRRQALSRPRLEIRPRCHLLPPLHQAMAAPLPAAGRARPRTSTARGGWGGVGASAAAGGPAARGMPQGRAGPVSPPLLPSATMSRRPNMSVRLPAPAAGASRPPAAAARTGRGTVKATPAASHRLPLLPRGGPGTGPAALLPRPGARRSGGPLPAPASGRGQNFSRGRPPPSPSPDGAGEPRLPEHPRVYASSLPPDPVRRKKKKISAHTGNKMLFCLEGDYKIASACFVLLRFADCCKARGEGRHDFCRETGEGEGRRAIRESKSRHLYSRSH